MKRHILLTLLGLVAVFVVGAVSFGLLALLFAYIHWAIELFPPFDWRAFALVFGPIVVPALFFMAHEVGALLVGEEGKR